MMNKFNFFGNYINDIMKGDNMETLQKIALVFTVIGAINWGLIGFFDFNLVTMIFGDASLLTRIIYMIVGIAGIINIYTLFSHIESK